jgi:Arc/MetJ-type ribon-helix-helix transcriptional regulator
MPTKLPRHTITETPSVREALDELRRRGEPVSLPELVILGARGLVEDLDRREDQRAHDAALRERLVARLRSGEGLDLDAALAARDRGWTRG